MSTKETQKPNEHGKFIDRSSEVVNPKNTKATTNTTAPKKTAHRGIYEARDAEYTEIDQSEGKPVFFAKLVASARSVLTFGGLNFLIFYWEQNGLMAESISLPCMWVCCVLAGWGAGKVFARECRR